MSTNDKTLIKLKNTDAFSLEKSTLGGFARCLYVVHLIWAQSFFHLVYCYKIYCYKIYLQFTLDVIDFDC